MSDLILMDGDKVLFLPAFGGAIVIVQPGKLQGSGPACIGGNKVCVAGDEVRVSVPGCTYMTPQYSIPGVGTLKIAKLARDQMARKTRSGGKAVLIKGSRFSAKFEVQSAAKQPPPGPGSPVPDPSPQYSGEGLFVPANLKLSAA